MPDAPHRADAALILMSRAPVAGATKTRLCPPLTPEQARDFHAACLQDLLEAAADWRTALGRQGTRLALYAFVTPSGSAAAFRAAGVRWPEGTRLRDQQGDTLGARMEHALRTARAETGGAPALLTGSDLPLLGAAQWAQALAALADADVAFGPTPDGGYYLVAVRCDPGGLFDLAGWGGATVLERSRRLATGLGRRTALIEALPDADTVDDLRRIRDDPRSHGLSHRRALRLIHRSLPDAPAERS